MRKDKQQQLTLRVMIEKEILRAILRTESAYKYYKEQRLYHQALRIYKANEQVYDMLLRFYLKCSDDMIPDVLEYIFHLEDWFEQFDQLKKTTKNLDDEFIFERLQFGIGYPSKFKTKLK